MEKGYYDASILLEYTSSDFAIGRFALQACNDEPVCNWYTQRAMNWKNLLIRRPVGCSPETRMARGNVMTLDWRESTYKNYFWMVPYDLQGLIDSIGGKRRRSVWMRCSDVWTLVMEMNGSPPVTSLVSKSLGFIIGRGSL